jgi:hypothetical protein
MPMHKIDQNNRITIHGSKGLVQKRLHKAWKYELMKNLVYDENE